MIEYKFSWVPVNERLPDLPERYFVTYKGKYMTCHLVAYCYFSDGKFECENATAWGNLPLPYDIVHK